MTAIILRRRKLGRTSCREIAAASTEGISVVRNWRQLDMRRVTKAPKYLFRWGCTSTWDGPRRYEDGDYGSYVTETVNSSESIHWCSNKKQGRLDMQAAGVPVPETWAADEWFDTHTVHIGQFPDKYVLRMATHAQGRNLVHGSASVNRANMYGEYIHGYVSRLIDKVAEYRVFVCQNRAVWVAKKTPGNPDDVAWNVAQGGRFDNVRWGQWNMDVVDAALQAARVSGTDFCGVDVMVDADGMPYVLEVNSAPSQTSPYRQQCVAKAFDYIVRNGKQHFPNVEAESWRDVIHPALMREDDA